MVNIEKCKKEMKEWTDSAGNDLAGDIDSIQTIEDIKEILNTHKDWLEDMCTESQTSTDDFQKKLIGIYKIGGIKWQIMMI